MIHNLIKQRLTAVLESDSNWSENISTGDSTVKICNENGEVQDRKVFSIVEDSLNQFGKGVSARITWKGGVDLDFSAIKPQLASGLTVYVEKGNVKHLDDEVRENFFANGFIETPVNFIWHSDKWNEKIVNEWLNEKIVEEINWAKNDYDITILTSSIQIDEYYYFDKNFTLSLNGTPGVRKEMGIFTVDTLDSNDINMSGVRCNWDVEDASLEKCVKTLLFLHPFHVNGSVRSTEISLEEPTGLHPTVTIDLQQYSDVDQCSYFAYFHLPKEIFVDQFQSKPVFLFGESNLELPEYNVMGWGSVAMFELNPGTLNSINLHSRYIAPSLDANTTVSASFFSNVFFACDTGNEQLAETPFYSKIQGYESFFTPDTKFYHLNSTCLTIDIPKLNSANDSIIEFGTLSVVLVSVLFLMKKVFG